MKITQRGFIIPLLLVIIAVLLAGGGTYVYVQNKQANQVATVTPTPQATSTTQASGLQVADWKTYTNAKYGFEFKYPSESTVKVRQDLNYQYIRIEKLGSATTNYKDGISSGEYYLEIFIYDHNLGQIRDPRFCESILNPKKVELGMITGLRGNYSGGDSLGIGLAMCVGRLEVDFDISGSESGGGSSILNPIFDSFKFTP